MKRSKIALHVEMQKILSALQIILSCMTHFWQIRDRAATTATGRDLTVQIVHGILHR